MQHGNKSVLLGIKCEQILLKNTPFYLKHITQGFYDSFPWAIYDLLFKGQNESKVQEKETSINVDIHTHWV